MHAFQRFAIGAAALMAVPLLAATAAQAQTTKWDMPTGYSDGTFQTVNVREFVADVKAATNGRLDIQVHSNASLVRMPEMRRAVATGQVQAGELLVSVLSNEDPCSASTRSPGSWAPTPKRASFTAPPASISRAASTAWAL